MIDRLADALLAFIDRQPGDAPYATAMEGLGILRSDQPGAPAHRIMQPSICIVARGAKRASFGTTHLDYRAGQALVIGVETPSLGGVIQASPGAPCLVLALALDLDILRAVAEKLEALPPPTGNHGRGVFVEDVGEPLVDCAVRIVRLLDTPEAIPTLHPVIMREISYWLLTGQHGGDIARLVLANPSRSVVAALSKLRADFRTTIRVDELAAVAGMSLSAFHRQFRALTSLSPLQYQKQLRLLEARRLMLSAGANVETAAFAVGYQSASQFSREYARLFSSPPKRDIGQMQALVAPAGRNSPPDRLRRRSLPPPPAPHSPG